MIVFIALYIIVFSLIIFLLRMPFIRTVAVIIALHLIVFLMIYILRVPIAEGRYLNPLRWVMQTVCPPRDLYNHVLQKEIRVDEKNKQYSYKFRIKYDGKQGIGLLLNNFTLFRKNSRKLEHSPLIIRVKMHDNNNVYFEGLLSKWITQFDGQYGSGIVMKDFWSPLDVPSRKDIQCDIEVVIPDKQLQEYYAPIQLFIGKESEQ